MQYGSSCLAYIILHFFCYIFPTSCSCACTLLLLLLDIFLQYLINFPSFVTQPSFVLSSPHQSLLSIFLIFFVQIPSFFLFCRLPLSTPHRLSLLPAVYNVNLNHEPQHAGLPLPNLFHYASLKKMPSCPQAPVLTSKAI